MALSGLNKAALRKRYPPVSDGGAAASRVVALWETDGLPESVFCYISGKDECSTIPILCFCLKNGIPLAVPLCEEDGGMTARPITSLSQLKPGRFGILEPTSGSEILTSPDAVIVPGLAFDREGYRLGRGGGYYDRWLAGRKCRTVGLCHTDRLFDRLPRDGWDVPVDTVQTGS